METSILQRAKEIIFSNEGNYGSVNANDNGALSIGICQWHGNRAKQLLQNILRPQLKISKDPDKILYNPLRNEIMSAGQWNTRTLADYEKTAISKLLITPTGKATQDAQANIDVQAYITHIMSLGFTDEKTIIFLADIENQGGAGASVRIGQQALKTFGKNVTLERVLITAKSDVVFSKYTARRNLVYKKLTESNELEVDGILGVKTIKALQQYFKVQVTGVLDKPTIKALQIFLNKEVK
jgi:hypothetical protein